MPLLYQVNRALNIQDGFIALAYALNLAFGVHNRYAVGIKNVRKGCSLAVVNTNPYQIVFIKPCDYRESAVFPKIYKVTLKRLTSLVSLPSWRRYKYPPFMFMPGLVVASVKLSVRSVSGSAKPLHMRNT